MKNGRRQFLKTLGLLPALPAIGWLPARPTPVEAVEQPTFQQALDTIQRGARDAMREQLQRPAAALTATAVTASMGHASPRKDDR